MSEYKCYLVESFQCAMSQLECYDIYSVSRSEPNTEPCGIIPWFQAVDIKVFFIEMDRLFR